jgi:hypothetical protein
MKGVFKKGGSEDITRCMTTAQLKMEIVYNLCNMIEIFLRRKVTNT